ncbi:MAG: beta-propeller fold lactonase family protein [Acidobacteria bacterium]|nr:beta-propeller fold lactonase family protein [Acidobacteriota bacterium]
MKSKPSSALAASLRVLALFALSCLAAHAQENRGVPAGPRKVSAEGVTIEFGAESLQPGGLVEGGDAVVKYRITYSNTGAPITGLRPAAWIGRYEPDASGGPPSCRAMVQSFLQPSFSTRPEIDMNGYLILTLNDEPNVSVIDPISGFSSMRLLTLVELDSPGEDWALGADQKRLYVSTPEAGRVAVVDTTTWKTVAKVEVGGRPARLALQEDGRYLWVGDGGAESPAGGVVTVIDVNTLKVVARVKAGAGPHEIAFSDDDRQAVVLSRPAGTLSVVDVRTLSKVKEVKVGARPSGLAYSALGRAFYVADETGGTITVIDGRRFEVIARLTSGPGLRSLRVSPDGRYVFAVNSAANSVAIVDVANNRLVQTVPVERAPDQVTFTKDFAYVRALGSQYVSMIRLNDVAKGLASVARFPAGQMTPGAARGLAAADAVVPAPESGSVLVANPADKMVYYYAEGMAAPMGSFQNYRRVPRAVLVKDNSLREVSPGVYSTTVRLGSSGHFDVALLLDSPRVVQCFDIAVAESPEERRQRESAVRFEPLVDDDVMPVGRSYKLRFKVVGSAGQPRDDLKDVGVMTFLAPGIWQERFWSKPVGGGVYEVSFTPPSEGVYYIYFNCPSLNLEYNQSPFLTLRAEKR